MRGVKKEKAVEVYNVNCSKKSPKPSILTLTNAILLARYARHKLFVSVNVSSYTRSIQFPSTIN
jgi:hypothetical protein